MDNYTAETRAVLDMRFKETREDGIYYSHQPIYGFRVWPCEWYFAGRYIPTHQIMKALARLRCESLLDVGGAEGYKAYIAGRLLGMRVESSDLSAEACKRAEEIFRVKATAADIHELPFAAGQFDVVVCSETLEHVTDTTKAIEELLRVAKKALVITVPHEDPGVIAEEEPHGHIHAFDMGSFDYLRERGYRVLSKKIMSRRILYYGQMLEHVKRVEHSKARRWPKFAYALYNGVVPMLGGRLGARVMAALVAVDGLACRRSSDYLGVLCVIVKDPGCYGRPRRRVSAVRVIKCAVPYYRLSE